MPYALTHLFAFRLRTLFYRLENEVRRIYLDEVLKGDESRLKKFKMAVDDPPNRRTLGFIGGAIMADMMSDNVDFWVSKQEWEEEGAACLERWG